MKSILKKVKSQRSVIEQISGRKTVNSEDPAQELNKLKSYIVKLEKKLEVIENDKTKERVSLLTIAFIQKIDEIAEINFSKKSESQFSKGIDIHEKIDEVRKKFFLFFRNMGNLWMRWRRWELEIK